LVTQAEKETKGAEKVASILVEQEDILAVVGHMGSDVTLAAAPRYKDELVVISPSSTAIREKNDSCTPYEKDDSVCFNKNVFRVTLNDSKAASFLVRAILTKNNNSAQKIERVAIAYDAKSTYSNSFKSAFEKKFESEFGVDSISIEDQCDFSKGNYNGQECWDTVSNKVQAILLIPGELSTAVKVTEDIIAANYDSKKGSRLFLLGSDTMYQENFVVSKGEARSDTKGMLIPITWHRTIENKCSEQDKKLELECKAAQIFHSKEKLEEKSPLAINWRTATSYEATKAILNGLKIAQESNEYCGKRWSLERINLRDCLRTKLKDVLVSDDFNNMQIRGATAIIQFQDGKGNGEIFGERELTKDLGVVVEARNKNFYTFPLKEIN
ncbi:MAG: ABC transporter substrate-binding protein, partial [Cyanobacteria bacterium J06635_10]